MKALFILGLIVTSLSSVSSIYSADTPHSGSVSKQISMDTEGQPFNLPELGSVIAKHKDSLRVIFGIDASQRTKPYQTVELHEGDILLMMNGKKLTSTEDLQKAYDSIAIGKNVEFGVRRDGKLMLVSFPKADPKDLPVRKMIMQTGGPNGQPGDKQVFTTGKIEIPDDVKDAEPTPGLGLFLGTKNSKLVVATIMPFAKEEHPELNALKVYDEVVSVNGKAVVTHSEFMAAYDALKVGEKFTIAVKRGGNDISVSLAKPEGSGMQIIRKK